jgi:hypothetical protein
VYGHCVVPALCRRCRLRVRKRETRDVEDGRDFKGELARARARAGRIRIMIGTRRFVLCGSCRSLKDGLLSSTIMMRYSKEDARKEKRTRGRALRHGSSFRSECGYKGDPYSGALTVVTYSYQDSQTVSCGIHVIDPLW